MVDKRTKPKTQEVKDKIRMGSKAYHDCAKSVGCKKSNAITLKSKTASKAKEKMPIKSKAKNKKQKIKKISIKKERALEKIRKIIKDTNPKPKKKK